MDNTNITKIKRFDKNYHREYYQEKRKYKMNIKKYINKEPINNFYILHDINRHINDYCELQLLKEFDTPLNIHYDINEIKALLNCDIISDDLNIFLTYNIDEESNY